MKPPLTKLFQNKWFLLLLVFGIFMITGTGIDQDTQQVKNIVQWTQEAQKGPERKTASTHPAPDTTSKQLGFVKSPSRPEGTSTDNERSIEEINQAEIALALQQMDYQAIELEAPPEEIIALADGLGKQWRDVISIDQDNEISLPDELKNHQQAVDDYNKAIDQILID